MMYRRPKLTKSGHAQEVTGPWLDDDYYTNVLLADANAASPAGSDWTILKSQLVLYWQELSITKVY